MKTLIIGVIWYNKTGKFNETPDLETEPRNHELGGRSSYNALFDMKLKLYRSWPAAQAVPQLLT